ncbi:hypothetical protein [Larkinella humicola]|uniref:Uncharacterized protein n=1 Tax=Larkinella humicola TaxID=2607654 RepID=A0A5N1JD54_9BACT|nr:hypothetical protein [Larkinella humicola]KAA9349734.1 hypothetical protein F0P93_19985 [Larkinella humicola]
MAKTKTEIIAQIRFGINQLSARNGQMDFEHICRFYARSRIHINILPATGPVQAGGDQGRDFETFHSYMAQCSIASTSSVGLFSKEPVAFACSLEQDPAKKNGKIERDVATILKSGVPVERIYFFSGQDIPVSKRHKVQERIRKSTGVPIEVMDAQSLAEHLSDSDLFWVANRYLDVPSEYYVLPAGPTWYNDLKAEFERRPNQDSPPTFEEFSEIKSALRRIYKDTSLKIDLPFWFDKLSIYLQEGIFRSLKRKAIYEQFVAKLIGQNDTTNQEELIRDYYTDFTEYRTPALLEDATILLSFIINSKHRTGHLIDIDEIAVWKEQLWSVLEQEYAVPTENNGRKVWLAVIMAQFQFLIAKGNNPIKALSTLAAGLQEAVPYFEGAVFYPFRELSNSLNHIIEVLLELDINDPVVGELESIARLVDEEVGKRYGQLEASEQLKQRAVKYFQKKRYLEALNAFHQLKYKWVSASSPKWTILASIFIAECYKELRMDYASRYYAFAAAQVIVRSEDVDLQKYLPKALIIAAEACYRSGAWLSYVDTLDLCILSHRVATKDFEVYDESKQHVGIIFHPAMILYIAKRFNLGSQYLFTYRFKRWGYISEEIDQMLDEIKARYNQQTDQELYRSLQGQLNDRVYNDFGLKRTVSFETYGSRWMITFENDFNTNAAAEQLVAIIQILMVELHDTELYLLRSTIYIDFDIRDDISMPEQYTFSSNEEIHWRVNFPAQPSEDLLHNSQVFYSALVISILQEISLLPIDELMAIIHTKFDEQGLVGRLLFVATYQVLYEEFVSKIEFNESARQHFDDGMQFSQLESRSNPKLPWNETVAPKYDQSVALQAIQNRMSFMYPYEVTLPKLKQSSSFKQVVQVLRDKGWLDWQIAVAIGNIIVNYKIQKTSPIYDPAVMKARAFDFYRKPEKEWYIPIPELILTAEKIEMILKTSTTLSVLQSFGLESHSDTPNVEAILELLAKRFNYLVDGADVKVFN